MSDLSETELLAATTVHDRLKAVNVRAWVDPVALIETDRLQRAALEIQRHRSALAADKERVRSVVVQAISQAFEAYDHGYNANRTEMIEHAAHRAAEQLATASACSVGPVSSRACERGTKGCVTQHAAAQVVLNRSEATLAHIALGFYSSDYNDAPHEAIEALRNRLAGKP